MLIQFFQWWFSSRVKQEKKKKEKKNLCKRKNDVLNNKIYTAGCNVCMCVVYVVSYYISQINS